MLKYAGLAVIIAVTSFAGCFFSSALKIRLVNLKKINFLIDEIIIHLRYKASTVYEITDCLARNERFSDFNFLNRITSDNNIPFQQNWSNAIKAQPPSSLRASDLEILADIGKNLGTSDIEGQLSMLSLQRAELETLIASAEKECEKKSKLYRSFGVLAGAFISVMLI